MPNQTPEPPRVTAKLRVVLYADDVAVADSESVDLWQSALASILRELERAPRTTERL